MQYSVITLLLLTSFSLPLQCMPKKSGGTPFGAPAPAAPAKRESKKTHGLATEFSTLEIKAPEKEKIAPYHDDRHDRHDIERLLLFKTGQVPALELQPLLLMISNNCYRYYNPLYNRVLCNANLTDFHAQKNLCTKVLPNLQAWLQDIPYSLWVQKSCADDSVRAALATIGLQLKELYTSMKTSFVNNMKIDVDAKCPYVTTIETYDTKDFVTFLKVSHQQFDIGQMANQCTFLHYIFTLVPRENICFYTITAHNDGTETVAGSCMVIQYPETMTVALHFVSTYSEYRRKNIATNLIKKVLRDAREACYKHAIVMAPAHAYDMFSKLDFKPIRCKNDYMVFIK